jgi:hypothetical protein
MMTPRGATRKGAGYSLRLTCRLTTGVTETGGETPHRLDLHLSIADELR